MEKMFMCIWGVGYQGCHKKAKVENHSLDFFIHANGFEPEHTRQVQELEVGESCEIKDSGNLTVVRVLETEPESPVAGTTNNIPDVCPECENDWEFGCSSEKHEDGTEILQCAGCGKEFRYVEPEKEGPKGMAYVEKIQVWNTGGNIYCDYVYFKNGLFMCIGDNGLTFTQQDWAKDEYDEDLNLMEVSFDSPYHEYCDLPKDFMKKEGPNWSRIAQVQTDIGGGADEFDTIYLNNGWRIVIDSWIIAVYRSKEAREESESIASKELDFTKPYPKKST